MDWEDAKYDSYDWISNVYGMLPLSAMNT
jgi:hypothetical protein